MKEDYDVIIIGARVAGSILATLLGELGYRVLLIDRASFPSDTLSSHFFRAPTFRAFERVGVFQEVQSLAPHLTLNYNVIDGIEFSEAVDRPDDYPFYLCVRRITLDEILINKVKASERVTLKENARAIRLVKDGERVSGVVWRSRDDENEIETTASVVVGADGINSFVAGNVQYETEYSEPVNRAMYYAYYRGVEIIEGPAAEFHYRGNTQAYCFPCDDGLTLLAISIPISQFKEFKKDPESNLLKEFQLMTKLGSRMSKAERVGPVRGTGSIPGYLRVPYGSGWALVGDAAMAMDPWSGQGMDQASTHAVFLAESVHSFLAREEDWESAMRSYHLKRNDFSLKALKRTCEFGRDFRPMTSAALKRRGLAD